MKRKPITTQPELIAQWHPTKNGTLNPDEMPSRSNIKIWWKCPVADDHEWLISPKLRGKSGCPYCANRKVALSNCLATTHPKLASEWHPTKNGNLTPYDITSGFGKKVWWKCSTAEDHELESLVISRARGNHQCPCCCRTTLKVVNSNCLATTHPQIAASWHPTKNGSLTPKDVVAGSHKMIWWKCPVADDHEWEIWVKARALQGYGCPCCARLKAVPSNCLATTHPKLAEQWHPTKNGNLTPYDIVSGSTKEVWWKCSVSSDHEWSCRPNYRTSNNNNCPCCSGHKAVKSNCLVTTHPKISEQWHPTKNGSLTPNDVTAGSIKLVWWKCSTNDNHEWLTSTNNRTNHQSGCPICSESKGELMISELLANMGIKFRREWKFKSCKNKRPLPFDFVIHYKNQIAIIEYQGKQHYEPISFGGKIINHDEVKLRDQIKRDWCKQRNIPLLEVPYWEHNNANKLLENFLTTIPASFPDNSYTI